MAETKWTAGPWRAVKEPESDGPWGWHVKGENDPNGVCGFALEHDAQLIASAPDLYAALEGLDALYARAWDLVEPSGAVMFTPETVAKFEDLHEAASKALALARGEKP